MIIFFKKKYYIIIIINLFILLSFSNAFCKDYTYININNPFIKKIPVAIPDFKNRTSKEYKIDYGEKARQILVNGLSFTGYIKTINKGAYIYMPSKTGITKQEINFKNWTIIGAEFLITGVITEIKDNIKIELRLFDTFKENFILGKIYTGAKSDIRIMVHRFCSEISYYLTGEKGIFNSKLVFISTVKKNKEIFISDFDGYNPKQITHHKSITLSPSWSSDGQFVAYTSYVKGNPDIYIQNLKKQKISRIGFKGVNITPDWVPNKLVLAACLSYSGDHEIYLLTIKGKIIKRITNNWGIDISPEFSPDGKKIAFVSKRSGTPQIYIKDLDTNQVKRITFNGNYNTSPAWSLDGNRLAYIGVGKAHNNIYVIGTDGSQCIQLTNNAGNNEDPAWSSDSNLITFTSTREGVSRIYVMTASGDEQRCLLKLEGSQTDPEWSLVNANN
ncbi:MAG: Tol-Pal system beta propeller repeat protein TolB [Desulfobacteraceae bacterium 4572_130]|nr:MAG: Tol-Pal system beta propeller repeat protein TolB [Desulfobacteraceae bacterium 4572_130]